MLKRRFALNLGDIRENRPNGVNGANTCVLTLDETREVLDVAIKAIGPDMQTPRGFAAARAIGSLLAGRYSKRAPRE